MELAEERINGTAKRKGISRTRKGVLSATVTLRGNRCYASRENYDRALQRILPATVP